MKHTKWIASIALALGMAGTSLAGDLRHDYRKIEKLRAEVQRDRYRIDQDMRRGHLRQADRDRARLARDEYRLRELERDARYDRRYERAWR